ncbi:PRC and DUF2382 domain-containing protein [Modestobacter lapidis]|nr:PRC and DUF2382 domain-containing protein [Modestobacter lapidis]
MTSEPELPPVIGAIADDRDGKPLGTVTAVFVDDVTGRPTWVGLTDGLHAAPDATAVAIVAPITDARLGDGRLRLTVAADAVHSSPRPGAPDRLSPAEEVRLQEHYAGRTGIGIGTDRAGTVGDRAMTRSEERFSVQSVTEPWTRAVLRIEEVTEEVMVPVTVTRQQARIEYLPLRPTDGRADADTGDAADDRRERATEWVTLYGDQPVVTMERAPLERVRLATSWVTEELPVGGELRHEEVELTTDSPLT